MSLPLSIETTFIASKNLFGSSTDNQIMLRSVRPPRQSSHLLSSPESDKSARLPRLGRGDI